MEKDFIRIQLQHDCGTCNQYTAKELDDVLQKLNLPEIPLYSIDRKASLDTKWDRRS